MNGALTLLGLTVIALGVMLSKAIGRINEYDDAVMELLKLVAKQELLIQELTEKLQKDGKVPEKIDDQDQD